MIDINKRRPEVQWSDMHTYKIWSAPRDSSGTTWGTQGYTECRKALWRKWGLRASCPRMTGGWGLFQAKRSSMCKSKMAWFGSLVGVYLSWENLVRRLENGAESMKGFKQHAKSDIRLPPLMKSAQHLRQQSAVSDFPVLLPSPVMEW